MVDGVAWHVDLESGNHWPVDSDLEMSEAEVEQEVQQGRGAEDAEEAGRAEEGVGQEDDTLTEARELVRAEVRLVLYMCPFGTDTTFRSSALAPPR
jgi:hypothetical protein